MVVEGIFKPADFINEIRAVRTKGFDKGKSIGIEQLDPYYRVKLGMMSIVTGIPQSGKSELVDAITCNLAQLYNWKFAFYSPENYPLPLHFVKIAEKFADIQFHRMSPKEHDEVTTWVGDHYTWIYPDEEREDITLDTILSKAQYLKESEGLDGLIIDPWNELEHNNGNMSMTTYISQCLSKIRRFARKWDIHVWIVAHPTKMQKDKNTGKYPVPTLYDISDSAHWRNKADFGIVVHRDNLQDNDVDVYIQKVKFKHMGKVGNARLSYKWETGRYY